MKNNHGVSLLEVILAMTLFSSLIVTFIPFMTGNISTHKILEKNLVLQQNTRLALNYIEKRIRECDQQNIIYHHEKKLIESTNETYEKLWIDLSGNKRNSRNTLLYFYRPTNELRVNKNGENNVLVGNIKDIVVTEVLEGKLLEIEVIADEINYSVKSRMKLKYR